MVMSWTASAEQQLDDESWPIVTMIADRNEEATARRLSEAVEAQLSDLRVSFVVRLEQGLTPDSSESRAIVEQSLRDTPEALATFWVSLEEERLFLALISPSGQMVLSRTLEGSGTGAHSEIVANILRASIQVLLDESDGGQVLLESETWELEAPPEPPEIAIAEQNQPTQPDDSEAEVQPPSEEGTPQPRRPRILALEVGYHLGVWSRTHPAVHGIALSAIVRLYRSLYASFAYRVTFPLEEHADDVFFKLRPHPFSLALWYGWERNRVFIAGGAAVTVAYFSEETVAQAPMVAAEETGRVVISAEPFFRLRVRLYGRLSLVSMIGVSILFQPLDFVVDAERERRSLIEMWRAQPFVFAGLSVGLI